MELKLIEMDIIYNLSVIGLIVLLTYLYQEYKKKSPTYVLKEVKKDPPKEINLDDIDLDQLPNEIPYVMISGIVVPVQEELKSESNNRGGVIQVIEVKERYRTYKQDEKDSHKTRIVSKVVNNEPFYLASKNLNVKIEIVRAIDANCVLNELETISHRYEPVSQSMLKKLFTSVISNETVKGVETSEKMLKTGTHLLAFGKLKRIDNGNKNYQYYLSAPDNTNENSFILTRKTRAEILTELEIKKDKHSQQNKSSSDESTCVICFTNPREFILLDCGHICLCQDCLSQLPTKTCPICTKPFRAVNRYYIP